MQQTLLDCVSERWQPGFNDPYVLSWIMVAIYLLATILALAVARRAPFPAATRRRERVFWIVVAIVSVVMAVNKQADLQTLMLATGGCLSRAQGWHAGAQWLKAVTTMVLALLAIGLGTISLWALRRTARRTALPMLGLTLTVIFIAFRAAELLGFLGPFRALARSHWADRFLELSGPAVVIMGAVVLLGIRDKSKSRAAGRDV